MKKIIYILSTCCMIHAGTHAQSWSITGNSGTNPPTNFLGTTDNKALVFKTNNAERMRVTSSGSLGIGINSPLQKLDVNGNINIRSSFALFAENRRILKVDSVNKNIFLGNGTGFSNTTGSSNTVNGYYALHFNTTGNSNTATGLEALYSNTGGNFNTAIGSKSLHSNTTGVYNTATGYLALYANTTAENNTAYGAETLEDNTGANNSAFGTYALRYNSTGIYNTANGSFSLYNNTTGINNTAAGYLSLSLNTTGSLNTATGAQALYSNTSGSSNTANGFGALYANTVGNENTAYGYQALNFNTASSQNIAIGKGALYSQSYSNGNSTYHSNNVAVGYEALYSNQPVSPFSGDVNTAVGNYAMHSNTTGYSNAAFGYQALYTSTNATFNTACGAQALLYNTASNNTATGADALMGNTTGRTNTADGNFALQFNTTGSQNTGVGYFTLHNTLASDGNTALGYIAGGGFNNGYYNTYIGSETDANTSNIYNSTALGRLTIVTAPSQVRIGNSFVTSIGGYAGWSNISDGRVKKNVKENVPGLVFINKLKPLTYNLDLDAAEKIIQPPAAKDTGNKSAAIQFDQNARNAKQQIVYTGFIAQDVEKAAKEIGYNFSGVDAAKNDKDLYGLRYAEFVVPLVKAVQELSSQNENLLAGQARLKSENEEQKKINDELKRRLSKLETVLNVQQGVSGQQYKISSSVEGVALFQNIPNPFSHTTTINYTLPKAYSSAKVIISDKSGKSLKEVNLSGNGKGSLTLDASMFTSGTYQYSLIVDGRLMDTTQMILAK